MSINARTSVCPRCRMIYNPSLPFDCPVEGCPAKPLFDDQGISKCSMRSAPFDPARPVGCTRPGCPVPVTRLVADIPSQVYPWRCTSCGYSGKVAEHLSCSRPDCHIVLEKP